VKNVTRFSVPVLLCSKWAGANVHRTDERGDTLEETVDFFLCKEILLFYTAFIYLFFVILSL
jgi:hypothetical protein